MAISTLFNAIKHWALNTFATGADWGENAPSSSQYIKNRPFYSVAKIGEEVVYPVTTISPLEYDRSDQCLTWWDDSVSPVYEVGKTYVVTFNGVEYTCVCEEHDDGRRIIGNPTVLHFEDGNYDGGIPFVVLEIDGGFYGGVYDEGYYNGEYGAEEMSCSVGVRKVAVVEDIKSLDAKYLPSDIYATVVTLTEAEDGTVTADMTVDEVAELVKSGRRVVAITPSDRRVQLDQLGTTRQGKNTVYGAMFNNNIVTDVNGIVYSSGDTWTLSETTTNTADRTYIGDFMIQVDASNGALETSGTHSDGTIRSQTMALDSDLTSLATRVDALEGAGGGSGAFVVNFTTEDGETWTADKTFAEIKSAYDAGMFIRGCVDEDGDKGMAQFASLTDSTAEFRSIKLDNDKSVTYASLTVISGGQVYVHVMSGMLS